MPRGYINKKGGKYQELIQSSTTPDFFHAQLNTDQTLSMLIYVKMPTIVGILTFMSRINTTSESLIARTI